MLFIAPIIAVLLLSAVQPGLTVPWSRLQDLQKRMVNSQEMKPDEEIKALVSIEDADKKTFCGGAFIDPAPPAGDHLPNIVLTAAHCMVEIKKVNLPNFRIIAGRLDQRKSLEEEQAAEYMIKDYHCHEEYDSKPYANDICLVLVQLVDPTNTKYAVKTTDVFALDDSNAGANVEKADKGSWWHQLTSSMNDVDNENALNGAHLTVAGWGTAKADGTEPSPVARSAEMSIAQLGDCQTTLGTSLPADSIVCAKGKDGHADSCRGDSGGPLFTRGKPNNVIIGVVSLGSKNCGERERKYLVHTKENPAIHTRVYFFRQWIETTAVALRKSEATSAPTTAPQSASTGHSDAKPAAPVHSSNGPVNGTLDAQATSAPTTADEKTAATDSVDSKDAGTGDAVAAPTVTLVAKESNTEEKPKLNAAADSVLPAAEVAAHTSTPTTATVKPETTTTDADKSHETTAQEPAKMPAPISPQAAANAAPTIPPNAPNNPQLT